jgi:gamma-glutamylcyclotransferase (GGCT)/AIG2-like uncharacterized protein YtfP
VIAVYGTLRPAASGLDQLGARGGVRPQGGCVIPGRIINLGDYPGLLLGEGGVAGDLLRLLDGEVGEALDAFEDFDPRSPETSLYRRVRVRLLQPAIEAWVYVWNGALDAGPVITGGDWLRR